MISGKYKTIMVHIDKCAGTSICNHFQAYQGRHEKWNIYQKRHTYEWENYFKFAFVRNPWDRVVSAYLFHIFLTEADVYNNPRNIKKQQAPKTITKTLSRQEKFRIHHKNFNYFLRFHRGLRKILRSYRNTKFNPCYKYIYDEDMNCQVDFVGRYENLNEDMTYIQEKLGMPIEPIPHNNSLKSKKPHYSAFYNGESIEIIKELYKIDIELFSYEFERVVPYDHNLANTLDWVE